MKQSNKQRIDYEVSVMLNNLGLKSFDFSAEGVMGTNGNNSKIAEIKRLVEELMETMPKA